MTKYEEGAVLLPQLPFMPKKFAKLFGVIAVGFSATNLYGLRSALRLVQYSATNLFDLARVASGTPATNLYSCSWTEIVRGKIQWGFRRVFA